MKIVNYHLQQSEKISVNFEQEKPDTDDKLVYDPINKYFQKLAETYLLC